MEFGGEKTTFYATRNDYQCFGHQSTFGFIGNRSQNNVSSRLSEFKKHCFIQIKAIVTMTKFDVQINIVKEHEIIELKKQNQGVNYKQIKH